MKTFILKRFFALIWLLFGITFLVFILMQLAPGDFLTPIKAQRDIQPELIRELEQSFGLNQPWYEQYIRWITNVLRLDFGYSWTYKVPVFEIIAQRAVATLILSVCSLIFAWTFAIILGVLAAVYKDSIFDRLFKAMDIQNVADAETAAEALNARLWGAIREITRSAA